MKRRGFLGFLGGAVAAGPAVARNAVAQLPSGLGGLSTGYVGSMKTSAGIAHSIYDGEDWRLQELNQLKRFLTGEFTEEERESRRIEKLHSREAVISNRYAGLHSLSACRKIELFNRDMQELRDEISRGHARGRLSSLLKQIGGEA